ncbi:MAG TPA: type II secretion system F family protein [Flexivirga sp.]|uniref:type II secretion system F family protein n=1 Tax=Flexivirga sp. TaxID=1962927 RepID=UPI002BCE4533|nr:type II secretion system F family protein [Flexivirga sp.]HWC24831.1 type II secretion system F family protein [Flexivirga sp.]
MTVLAAACVMFAVLCWPGRPGPLPSRLEGRRSIRWRPRGRTTQSADLDALTTMVEGIAPAIAAGVTPATAVATSALLTSATVSAPALREDLRLLARQSAAGAELAPLWAGLQARHGVSALGEVARAWALSEQLGCAIGDALAAATAMMREQLDLERRIAGATAGPRATMQLLTVLPVLGIGIAMVIGVPPWRLYAGPLGLTVLVLGGGFVLAGRLLTRRMIRRASAPTVLT